MKTFEEVASVMAGVCALGVAAEWWAVPDGDPSIGCYLTVDNLGPARCGLRSYHMPALQRAYDDIEQVAGTLMARSNAGRLLFARERGYEPPQAVLADLPESVRSLFEAETLRQQPPPLERRGR